jgi:16S rRNA C967 or C1407 C5-methylase (RsmB/RsmF family)/NOL1/NOP2/fmu family ribosome biogenesis protein
VQLPVSLLDSLEGLVGFERAAFTERHAELDTMTSLRLNPSKLANLPYALTPVPWTSKGFYVHPRPSFTLDPLFHAGCYYVQEASSMLLEQAFLQCSNPTGPIAALDLCAAPGGKTTHLYSLLPTGSVLVANEVIRSRVPLLRDNCIKWGSSSCVVTQNDPAHFQALPDYFDWITLDAPCSGSGLFRRDPSAIEEWSDSNVVHCAQRQQRILAAAWQALKPGGILFYATCSYSAQENEQNMEWLCQQFNAQHLPIAIAPEWGMVASTIGYRCWPHRVRGEGFYCCCMQKPLEAAGAASKKNSKSFTGVSSSKRDGLKSWIDLKGQVLFEHDEQIFAWPSNQVDQLELIKQHLYIQYAGIRIGKWVKEKLIPDHALAMSVQLAKEVPRIELEKEQAIAYLQRKEFALSATTRGWNLITYQGFGLGWINQLDGRFNNYYPKELRILKNL